MILNDLQRFTFLIFLCFPFIFLDYGFFVSKYNLFNYPEFINFFRLITNIGDGILLLPFLALFFILSKFGVIKRKVFVEYFCGSLITIFLVLVVKNLIFDGLPRPFLYFQNSGIIPSNYDSYGITFYKLNSFPSGHTSTATFLLLFLLRFVRKRFYKNIIFLLLVLVGFSRIFLFQHFFVDVVTGFCIGILSISLSNLILINSYKIKNKLKVTW